MRYYDKYGRKKRMVAAGIIAAGCLSFVGYNIYQTMQDKAAVVQRTSLGYMVFSEKDYEKKMKDTSSDIRGMSKYDKIQKGLQADDNSDSDYDGLTDKEEIEKYGSDPLRASTAGDLYTDGYKATHGMDVTKKYDYDGKVRFAGNKCKEIKLTADDAIDMSAVVRDVTDTTDVSSFGINTLYKAYKIYNYSGALSIDTQKALPDDVELKNVKVKIFNGAFLNKELGELKDTSYNEGKGLITPEYSFESKDTYYILITGKTTFASALSSLTGTAKGDYEETGVAMFVSVPLVGIFTDYKKATEITYTKLKDVDTTNKFRNAVIDKLNDKITGTNIIKKEDKIFSFSSSAEINTKYEILKKFLPFFEIQNEKAHIWHSLFCYSVYNYNSGTVIAANGINGNNGDKTERRKYNNYHTKFDQYTDELCFQNFQSDYGPNGNCLGIAHFTSYLFNKGRYPSSGSYGDISWNLKKHDENKTLMDPGIFDYKDIHFVDDRTDKDNDYLTKDVLSSGEKEFVKMIGAAFREGNDKIDHDAHVKTNGELNDYSMLKKAMDYLDAGKVVNVCLLLNNGTGHAITLYDYYWLDDESVNFRVYDSNIPQNDRENYYIHADGASYLQCSVVTQPNGEKDFQYIYYPLENNTYYMASSYYYLMQKHCLIIMDENWNIFK